MTTGERLVEISTLETGTAMDHFLNISEIVLRPSPSKCPPTTYAGGGGIENAILEGMELMESIEDDLKMMDHEIDTPPLDLEEIDLDDIGNVDLDIDL